MFTIALTGDVLPTRPVLPDGVPPEPAAVFRLLHDADLAIGNWEMPLTEHHQPLEKLLTIKAVPSVAGNAVTYGLDLVTVANNHAVDHGWEGLADTICHLEAERVGVTGAGPTLAAAAAPLVREVAGARVGLLAFSCLLPTGMAAAADRPGLAPIHVETAYEIDPYYQMEEPGDPAVVKIRTRVRDDDLARACAAVVALRAEVDVLVASIHWGFGSGEALADYQRPLGRALIDSGADLVHGHHPHAIHAIGFHRGRPILFSLGTFVGQQVFLPASETVQALWAGMSADGYVALVEFDHERCLRLRIVPTVLDADRLPRLAAGADRARILASLERLSRPHGATVREDGGDVLIEPVRPAFLSPSPSTQSET